MNSSLSTNTIRHWVLPFAFIIALAGFGSSFLASTTNGQDLFLKEQFGESGEEVQDPVALSAKFKVKTGTRQGILEVTAEIHPDWHVFSISQKSGGPMPSKITVLESEDYKLIGKFKPDEKPHVHESEAFDCEVEEHEGMVTWSAPIEINEGVDIEDVVVDAIYNGQTCESKPNGSCRPISNIELEAEFDGFDESLKIESTVQAAVKAKDFSPDGLHTKIKGRIVRAAGTDSAIKPGDILKLEITATPQGEFHVYNYSLEEKPYLATVVGFTQHNDWEITGPSASAKPVEAEYLGEQVFYHHDPVTWTFHVKVPESAEEKTYDLNGAIGLHTCDDAGCDLPGGVKFSTKVAVGKTSSALVNFENGSYGDAQEAVEKGGGATGFDGEKPPMIKQTAADNAADEAADDTHETAVADSPELVSEMAAFYNGEEEINYETINNTAKATLWTAIFGAFVGGMLLNLMPCVFPVLGLKVMGFVQQAGSDPKKIRNHGLAFTFGLVVSMWVLAGFILFLKIALGESVNWGQQMGNPYFVCGIIVLLFLLGLNMAGVFEIGTSLTTVGGKAQQKKGYAGSFFSGILTTLIATPCSGPFLGAAMGYTIAQPAWLALILFTIFALGISMPYLLLSFFPSLIGRLPRPGEWMETFKVIMAFTLFATVAFFANTFGTQTGVRGLAWLMMALVVIGFAAYMYGKWSPSDVESNKRFLFGYLFSALLLVAGGWMCYDASNYQGEVVSHGQWQKWTPGKVEYTLAKKKKIVWVDYTADW